jgi:hypothetical protein
MRIMGEKIIAITDGIKKQTLITGIEIMVN